MTQQAWTGITYTVGDDVHVMPFDEYDTEHETQCGGDCPCGPEKMPTKFGMRPLERPQNVYRHRPVKTL